MEPVDAISSTVRGLRPAEALYLLHIARVEVAREENFLAGTLAHLAYNGYLSLTNGKPVLTAKGRTDAAGLRPYEINCLETIVRGDELGIVLAVSGFDFKGLMRQAGFFSAQREEKRLLWFKLALTRYLPTELFNSAVQELESLRGRMSSKMRLDEQSMLLSYAFPSCGFVDGFLALARQLVTNSRIALAEQYAMSLVYSRLI